MQYYGAGTYDGSFSNGYIAKQYGMCTNPDIIADYRQSVMTGTSPAGYTVQNTTLFPDYSGWME
jgi:hypothetical protein